MSLSIAKTSIPARLLPHGYEVDDHRDVLASSASVALGVLNHPNHLYPSKWAGSLINNCWPAARTASLAVCHEAPSDAATRAIESRYDHHALVRPQHRMRDRFVRGA